jgi:hypothetical protein
MTIQTDIAQADWLALVRFIVRSTASNTTARLGRWLVSIVIGLALALTFSLAGITLHFPSLIAGFAASTLLILITSRIRMRSMRPASDGYILGPRQVTVSDEGLRESSQKHELLFRWPAVRGAQVTGQHIFVMLDNNAALIVPRRAFSSDAEREQFVSEIQRRSGKGTSR